VIVFLQLQLLVFTYLTIVVFIGIYR